MAEFATNSTFSVLSYLDTPDLATALGDIEAKLVESKGANASVWDQQREMLFKQYNMRNQEHNDGSDRDVLVQSLKLELESKLQAHSGSPEFDAYQQKMVAAFETHLKQGLEQLDATDFSDKLIMQLEARLAIWEHQREDGLAGKGYHSAADLSHTVFAESTGDDYSGGKGITTLDFSHADGAVKVDISKSHSGGFGEHSFKHFQAYAGSDFDDTFKGSNRAESISGGAGDDILRGRGGADVLAGGDGSDRFVWFKNDVQFQAKHGEVDHVTDFGPDDHLDLTNLFKKADHSNPDALVTVKDSDVGAHLYARAGGAMNEVAILDGVHDLSVGDMVKSGMLLL
jgi:RTX calcium-binding nonapeptide repeat (4 copies)